MKPRFLSGALLSLLLVASGARAEVQITDPPPPPSKPPAIQESPAPSSTILLYGGAPSAVPREEVLPLPDAGALSRRARQDAQCLRLLKDNHVFCFGNRAVPLRHGHD